METIRKTGALLLITIILATFSFVPREANAQVGVNVSFQQFYDQLSPYGNWIADPDYGYIWIPSVAAGFQPYATNGRWVVTDYGNTWVSDYDWGWAPFHYGRWHHSNRFGWAWVPGYEWAPAWVSWRTGGGYYGWAPLGPGMNIQVNINLPMNYWTFVPQRYLLSNTMHRYYAPHRSVVNVYQRTTIINNTYVYNNRSFYSGPARQEIQRVTRREVPVHRIADTGSPGRGKVDNRTVSMYRPSIDRNSTSARPTRVANRENVSNNRTQATRTNENNASRGNASGSVLQRQGSRNATQVDNSSTNNRTSRQVASAANGNRSAATTNTRTATTSTRTARASSNESSSANLPARNSSSTTSNGGGQATGRSNNDRARSATPARTATTSRPSSTTDNKKTERVQSSPSAGTGTTSNRTNVKTERATKEQQQANGTRERSSRG